MSLTTIAAVRRALGYVRVSTDEQAEQGYSLGDQGRKVREHCTDREWNLVALISDDFTGKTLKRPGLREVLALAERREFDLLVCVKLDRLARQNYLRRKFERDLEELGIEVVFTEQHFERSPAGRFQRGIMGEVAEFEAELIRERTMSGKAAMARMGKMPGCSDPFGYRQVRRAEAEVIAEFHGRAGELLVIEERADLVREMFNRALAGASMRKIGQWLDEAGVKPPKWKPPKDGEKEHGWQVSAISNILRSPVYIGKRYWGKLHARQTEDVTSTGHIQIKHTPKPREEWVEIPCPAIVPEAVWHAVQRQLDENREQLRRQPREVHILQGCVYCRACVTKRALPRVCSCVYVGADAQRTRRYRCSSGIIPGHDYCLTSYPADLLEEMALDALQTAAAPGFLAARERRRAQAARERQEDTIGDLASLEKERERLDTEEMEVARLMLKGVSEHVTQKMLLPIQTRRLEIDRRLAAVQTRLEKAPDPEQAALHGEDFGKWIAAQLEAARDEPAKLRELFRLTTRITLGAKKDRRGPRPEPEIEIILPDAAIVHYAER